MSIIPVFAAISDLFSLASAVPLQNQTISTNTISHDVIQKPRQGWTSSPNERGTTDILWSCVSTTFLCCWSILCLNVPGSMDTDWLKFRRRAWIFVLTLCAPEIVSVAAMGQYLSARQSVEGFKRIRNSSWSLQHAFFADMGGFILKTRDWVPFPITAKQLLWLIERGYVSVPPAVSRHIKDKNKVDGMMRFVMVVQMTWFLANFVARFVQGLAITAIELTTFAFIYSNLPIMFLWRHKPADVGMAEVLVTDASIVEILSAGGDAAREPYSNTPLDFIDRKEWPYALYWSHMRGALQYLYIRPGHQARPVDRFSNFTTPEIPAWIFSVGAIYYFGFAAIFVSGWNISLPTKTERQLWRVASLVCLLTLFAAELLTEVAFKLKPYIKARWLQKRRKNQDHLIDGRTRHGGLAISGPGISTPSKASRAPPRTLWNWLRNNSVGQDPRLSLPLGVVLLMIVITLANILARIYIIVEDFLELRSLPLSCFETPAWQQFIPHLS